MVDKRGLGQRIDADLHRQLKVLSAESGRSMTELLEDGIRRVLELPVPESGRLVATRLLKAIDSEPGHDQGYMIRELLNQVAPRVEAGEVGEEAYLDWIAEVWEAEE